MSVYRRHINSMVKMIPCHRMPSRCIHVKGKPLPICSRCMSIFLGYLSLPLLFLFSVPFYYGMLLQLPLFIDGYTQKWKWRESTNTLRVISGLLSGFGQSIFVVGIIRLVFSCFT